MQGPSAVCGQPSCLSGSQAWQHKLCCYSDRTHTCRNMHWQSLGRHPQQPAGRRRHSRPAVQAAAQTEQLEEVDPVTGEVRSTGSVRARSAGKKVQAGGLTWAYREADVNPDAVTPGRRPIVMLHGIGSCSFGYRELATALGKQGWQAIAADWPGHGASDKPDSGSFDYSQQAYIAALDSFIAELGVELPVVLMVHGFVLGQYAMLWAAANPASIDRLVILNTPLSRSSKLRPELAAYKARMAFMRPDPKKKAFDGITFNAAGLAYAIDYVNAQAYGQPYEEDVNASVAIAETMNKVDFPALLREVDEAFCGFKVPSLLLFGPADPFIDITQVFEWLESKRTTMAMPQKALAKMGHMPQEDYPEAILDILSAFLEGSDRV